jgi:chromosome partitioning protein
MRNRIPIVNQKGGVAKTTTAVNLAATLVEQGRKVLLIDLCSQGQSSGYVGHRVSGQRQESPVYRVLAQGHDIRDHVLTTKYGFDLLAGGRDVAAAEALLGTSPHGLFSLREALDAEPADRWDTVLFDCPPSLSYLSQAALVAGTAVLVPTTLQKMSVDSFGMLMERVADVRSRFNPGLQLAGILKTNSSKKSALADEMRAVLDEQCGPAVLPREIRSSEHLANSYERSPITVYAPKSIGAEDYRWLASTLIERGVA